MLLDVVQYEYTAPDPVAWSGFGSHKEIENDFVTDSRAKIHLTVKLAPRKADPNSRQFSDRNVEDVKDGYVSCDPFQDTTQWGQVIWGSLVNNICDDLWINQFCFIALNLLN